MNPRLEERKAPARAARASHSGLHLHAHRTCRSRTMSSRWSGAATLPLRRDRQRLRDPPHSVVPLHACQSTESGSAGRFTCTHTAPAEAARCHPDGAARRPCPYAGISSD